MKNFIRITKLLETTEFTPEYADEQLLSNLSWPKRPVMFPTIPFAFIQPTTAL